MDIREKLMDIREEVMYIGEEVMDIREELLNNNPFSSNAAANPWDNASPDIYSLNKDVCDQVFHLVQNKAQHLRNPMAGLILGEAGSGKTHMLKRILSRIKQSNIDAIFVYVRAFETPERVFRELWREIFLNLRRSCNDGISQFDFIVNKMMNIYREHNVAKGSLHFDSTEGIQHFQTLLAGVRVDFLKALFAYYDPRDEERRHAAERWLQGNIDDDHHSLLRVEDRYNMSPRELEWEARELILSLGLVLDYCKMPTVICFDQLDGMEDSVLINAWGKAVAFVINDTFSLLPLAFLRDASWRRRFKIKTEGLDDAVVQRFEGNRLFLEGCSLEQARDLIRARITSLYSENAESKVEWLLERLEGKLERGYSPRTILELANHVVIHRGEIVPMSSVTEILDKAYREEYDKVAADFDMWPPDAGRLVYALEAYLTNHASFEGIKRPKDHKFVSLIGQCIEENAKKDCAFIVNTAEHNQTVRAALRRGVSFLETYPGRVCYYISDRRCVFRGPERWKTVHDELGKFKQLKGITLFLDRGQATSWYALTSLRSKLNNGDVTFLSFDGERTVGNEEFSLHLKQAFDKNLLELDPMAMDPWSKEKSRGKNIQTKKGKNENLPLFDRTISPPEVDELVGRIRESLLDVPMHLMKVDLLFGRLSGQSVAVTYEGLLEFIRQQNDVFALYLSGDGSFVQLLSD
ncbi:MAG: ATP-binding protein [Synergistaceae bacterium]|jgi:hypothetical protein|nr:ATP-binding protein [Synergistaceae bacterium]